MALSPSRRRFLAQIWMGTSFSSAGTKGWSQAMSSRPSTMIKSNPCWPKAWKKTRCLTFSRSSCRRICWARWTTHTLSNLISTTTRAWPKTKYHKSYPRSMPSLSTTPRKGTTRMYRGICCRKSIRISWKRNIQTKLTSQNLFWGSCTAMSAKGQSLTSSKPRKI